MKLHFLHSFFQCLCIFMCEKNMKMFSHFHEFDKANVLREKLKLLFWKEKMQWKMQMKPLNYWKGTNCIIVFLKQSYKFETDCASILQSLLQTTYELLAKMYCLTCIYMYVSKLSYYMREVKRNKKWQKAY